MLQDKIMMRTKVVVALYPFRAIEGGDLSLEKVREIRFFAFLLKEWKKNNTHNKPYHESTYPRDTTFTSIDRL